VGDARRAAVADWAFQTARLGGPVDKADWIMTPQTNDAYNGSLRDIVFPAGILQPPIFDAAADPAINYGAAGGVIGHELTHGFDDQGRKFDAQGKLADWWTEADAQSFDERAARLGAQYSKFEPLPGVHVNGALTMGENIADLGGLELALEAYRASLGGKPAPVLDGHDRRPARLPGLGPGVVRQVARRRDPPRGRERSALAADVPRQRGRAEHGRVVRGVRRPARGQALRRTRRARQNLVDAPRRRPRKLGS
jgi:hypothetical protein